jgi:hypothetical protein
MKERSTNVKEPDILETWRTWVVADAERRGLEPLTPMTAAFASTARRLRAADWNVDASAGAVPREPDA